MNALDLVGEKVAAKDITKAKAILQSAYGKEFDQSKFLLFFDLIQEDNWSNTRLEKAIKHLIKTNKYANWNIAELYNYGTTLHDYTWYLEQISKNPEANQDIIRYKIDNKTYYVKREENFIDLPFEKTDLGLESTLQKLETEYKAKTGRGFSKQEREEIAEAVAIGGRTAGQDRINDFINREKENNRPANVFNFLGS